MSAQPRSLGVPCDGELAGAARTDPAPVAGWGPVPWAGVPRLAPRWCAPSTAGGGKQRASSKMTGPKITKGQCEGQGGRTADAARVNDGESSGTSSLLDGDLSTALGFEASSAPHLLAEHPRERLQEELRAEFPFTSSPREELQQDLPRFLVVAVTLHPFAVFRGKKTCVRTWFAFRSAHISAALQLRPAAAGAGTGAGSTPGLGPSIEHGPKVGVSPALPRLGCSPRGSRNLVQHVPKLHVGLAGSGPWGSLCWQGAAPAAVSLHQL